MSNLHWQDRAHFFAVAAQIMRQILVNAAKARLTDKRGGRLPHLNLDEAKDAIPEAGRDHRGGPDKGRFSCGW